MIGERSSIFVLAGFHCYGEKRNPGESKILKIPQILKILILTKARDSLGVPPDAPTIAGKYENPNPPRKPVKG